VLVLRDGEIEESGSPDELLSKKGAFFQLAERQRLQAELEVEDA
jgi:ABC-type multidrug transport system fused ATPase/permease subunit